MTWSTVSEHFNSTGGPKINQQESLPLVDARVRPSLDLNSSLRPIPRKQRVLSRPDLKDLFEGCLSPRVGGKEKNPITTIEEAIRVVEEYQGTASDFQLPIADSLLDPGGMNMAIITDKILGVAKEHIEKEVLDGIQDLLAVCGDPKGFTKRINKEIKQIWESSQGHDPQASRKLKAVDEKIFNIRKAIEDGLGDATWANDRLEELHRDRDELSKRPTLSEKPPQIDARKALSYRKQLEKVCRAIEPAEVKKFLRSWVDEIKLAPERLEVEISYRVPEPFVHNLVAGARYSRVRQLVGSLFIRDWYPKRMGRHSKRFGVKS